MYLHKEVDKRRCGAEALGEKKEKVTYIIIIIIWKQFQVGNVAIFLIVVQTANGFGKPTKILIILLIK